jgi:superoxide dismutase
MQQQQVLIWKARQENILINLDMKNTAVRNNGGGFYNHNLFWNVMTLMEADFQQEIY